MHGQQNIKKMCRLCHWTACLLFVWLNGLSLYSSTVQFVNSTVYHNSLLECLIKSFVLTFMQLAYCWVYLVSTVLSHLTSLSHLDVQPVKGTPTITSWLFVIGLPVWTTWRRYASLLRRLGTFYWRLHLVWTLFA